MSPQPLAQWGNRFTFFGVRSSVPREAALAPGLERLAAQIAHGDHSGFDRGLRGRRDSSSIVVTMTAERAVPIAVSGALPASAVASLEQTGFVVLPGPFSAEQFDSVVDVYDTEVQLAASDDVRVGSTSTRVSDFVNRGPMFDGRAATDFSDRMSAPTRERLGAVAQYVLALRDVGDGVWPGGLELL